MRFQAGTETAIRGTPLQPWVIGPSDAPEVLDLEISGGSQEL